MKQLTASSEIEVSSLNNQVLQECLAMAKYALSSGKKVPPGIIEEIRSYTSDAKFKKTNELVLIHEKLCKTIAPANPKAILLLEMESARKRRLKFLGPIPLVRQLMLAALVSLFVFIFCQSFEIADTTLDVMDQSGLPFLLIISTLVASSGLGASFSALFLANKYITSGKYDPKHEASYWIRFILGIIAGITLSVLIPIGKSGQASQFGRPLLAMLGGFSANLVYRLLTRLAETVESLVTGSKEELVSVKEREVNIRAAEEELHARQEVASSLMNVVQEIGPQMDHQQVKDRLQAFINNVYIKGDSKEEHGDAEGSGAPGQTDPTPKQNE